ncbi:hypothetical protein PISMIDRAFT_672015 [Pisolithus microcarpus 441]|uniref:Unplaced genomic scaffold scaffold_4, whole genome shotgun sequence n=1 Tax=Pisolithus microcarpus 441 TaxID=765257 RepID=A0A0D0ADA4_9AGAM|nr:hypothetical protein PISMIDRAFT_672015 [Pisolithus microcarpus 441]
MNRIILDTLRVFIFANRPSARRRLPAWMAGATHNPFNPRGVKVTRTTSIIHIVLVEVKRHFVRLSFGVVVRVR